jgi:hypothetical protein
MLQNVSNDLHKCCGSHRVQKHFGKDDGSCSPDEVPVKYEQHEAIGTSQRHAARLCTSLLSQMLVDVGQSMRDTRNEQLSSDNKVSAVELAYSQVGCEHEGTPVSRSLFQTLVRYQG